MSYPGRRRNHRPRRCAADRSARQQAGKIDRDTAGPRERGCAVGDEGGGGEQDGPALSERRDGEQREQERRQQERVELNGEVGDERPDRLAPAQQQGDHALGYGERLKQRVYIAVP
jgi:hypothetical protein